MEVNEGHVSDSQGGLGRLMRAALFEERRSGSSGNSSRSSSRQSSPRGPLRAARELYPFWAGSAALEEEDEAEDGQDEEEEKELPQTSALLEEPSRDYGEEDNQEDVAKDWRGPSALGQHKAAASLKAARLVRAQEKEASRLAEEAAGSKGDGSEDELYVEVERDYDDNNSDDDHRREEEEEDDEVLRKLLRKSATNYWQQIMAPSPNGDGKEAGHGGAFGDIGSRPQRRRSAKAAIPAQTPALPPKKPPTLLELWETSKQERRTRHNANNMQSLTEQESGVRKSQRGAEGSDGIETGEAQLRPRWEALHEDADRLERRRQERLAEKLEQEQLLCKGPLTTNSAGRANRAGGSDPAVAKQAKEAQAPRWEALYEDAQHLHRRQHQRHLEKLEREEENCTFKPEVDAKSSKLTVKMRRTYLSLDRYFDERRQNAEKRRASLAADRNFLADKESLAEKEAALIDDGTDWRRPKRRVPTPGTAEGKPSLASFRRPSSARPAPKPFALAEPEDEESSISGSVLGPATTTTRRKSKPGVDQFVERMRAVHQARVEFKKATELRPDTSEQVAPTYTGRTTRPVPFPGHKARPNSSAAAGPVRAPRGRAAPTSSSAEEGEPAPPRGSRDPGTSSLEDSESPGDTSPAPPPLKLLMRRKSRSDAALGNQQRPPGPPRNSN